jgi:hypothetical protein
LCRYADPAMFTRTGMTASQRRGRKLTSGMSYERAGTTGR